MNRIEQAILDNIGLKNRLLKDEQQFSFIATCADIIYNRICGNGKLLICGNGGSAADAQHVAAEFIGRFMQNRKALPAIALTTDSSILTAVGNDYGFDDVFARQVDALCTANDILIVLSTSGNSQNLVNAMLKAREKGAYVMALLGRDGGDCLDLADNAYVVRHAESARIQEVHLLIEHLICEIVENYYVTGKK